MAGTLYVVATPIGNLEDLTFRALRILKSVDLIAAEDTRRTAKLLAHYDIHTRMVSLHEHNEVRETPRLVNEVGRGASIALVSDAGTPGISDPGARLVQAARAVHLPVVAVPGPNAVAAALSVSGFDASEFVFMGFPPTSGQQRSDWIERLAGETRALVFFEAPHRLLRTLTELGRYLVNRQILLCKELTKIHEISVVSPIDQMARSVGSGEIDGNKGEFALVLAPVHVNQSSSERRNSMVSVFGVLTKTCGVEPSEAVSMLALVAEKPESEVRRALRKYLYSGK